MKAISRFLFVAMLAVVPGACDNSGRPPDTTPPTIALTGDNPQTIAVGEAYVELGATATDNRDGDLSASIVVDASAVDSSVPGEYAVTYGVIDSSGNAATVVTRTVIYEDRTAPVITLLGENPQIIVLGGDYAELGATATDNVDGDLTVSVVINTDALNLAEIGAYGITYNVSDSAGNAAETVARTVAVNPPAPAEASVTVEGDIKKLIFTWDQILYADYYRLMENPDGHSGFTQVGDDIPADTLTTTRDIAVHLFNWVDAQYLVEACNVTGCSTSDVVTATDVRRATIGYFKASNTGLYDRFGSEVALSADGNTLAVGASRESSCATGIDGDQSDNTCEDSGAVYVFRAEDNGWHQKAYIKASNTDAQDSFGSAVALSADGTTLAVGASREDSCAIGVDGDQNNNSCENSGAVYVFRSGDTGWHQQAYIKASNSVHRSYYFDLALSGDGDVLAVGGSGVHVFRLEDGTWGQTDHIEVSRNSKVALNSAGDTLISAGYDWLYVFRDDEGTWTEQAVVPWLIIGASIVNLAVDANGNSVAVGFDWYYGGRVDVYRFHDGSWNRHADVWKDPTMDPEGSPVPISLALSANGEWLAVGTRDNHWKGPGSVDLLRADGENWDMRGRLSDPNSGWYDDFGRSVALSADGETLAVGAQSEESSATGINGDQEDNSAYSAGAVYVY